VSSRLADALRLLASVLILGAFALVAWKVGLFERDAATKVATLAGKTAGIHWIVPAFIAVYAAITAGISKLPLVPFLVGTAFGIIPGTLLATYVGDRFVAGMRGEDPQPLYIALAVTIVLFGLSFLPKLIEKSRQR
jgi:membrane protein DedA with SNARE-associated domain